MPCNEKKLKVVLLEKKFVILSQKVDVNIDIDIKIGCGYLEMIKDHQMPVLLSTWQTNFIIVACWGKR